jgi:hypothetical protein
MINIQMKFQVIIDVNVSTKSNIGPWSASNSCAKTLNQAGLGFRTKVLCKWTQTNAQNFLTIFEYS